MLMHSQWQEEDVPLPVTDDVSKEGPEKPSSNPSQLPSANAAAADNNNSDLLADLLKMFTACWSLFNQPQQV